MIKQQIRIFISTALLLFLFTVSNSSAQNFTITNFDAGIVIDQDGSFTVTETIDVEFHRRKHGIYREIPYRYKDELGNTVNIPIEVLAVTDGNGNAIGSKVSKQGNVVNIRIGNADIYVQGKQTYRIVYKVTNGLLYFDDKDELYWNVTGNFWNAEIEHVTANVTLNSSTKIQNYDYACYTGSYGANNSECIFEPTSNGGKFRTTTSLGPYDGFTIAYSFDKGIVAEPSEMDRFLMTINIKENWGFVLPIFTLLFMISHWRKKGRDPKTGRAITVQYSPPKIGDRELTTAEVGVLIDETLNPRDISASMIGLAVKGYIKIEETEEKILVFTNKDYKLTALKSDLEELTEFEQWLMVGLFQDGKTVVMISELKNKFYTYLPKLSKAIFKQLVENKYFTTAPDSTIGRYVGYAVVVFVFTVIVLLLTAPQNSPIKPIIASILTALPFFLFSKAMPAKTRKGALALSDVLGFQEFLERAEKDKLERMQDKELFSKYLPYAIALDVVDNWAKAFEGIEQNLPNWYVGSQGMMYFHPVAFSQAITATTSHLSTATFSAPRSSGTSGGGGGFSGGGGGGGGGGSW